MKRRLVAVLAPALAAGVLADATVQTSLHCLSLRVMPASAKLFGITYTLAVGREAADPTNGELFLLSPEAPYSHGCHLRLEDDVYFTPAFLPCLMDIPPFADLNRNGMHDFFEVSQGVSSARTTGVYDDPIWGESDLRVTWSRPTGSKDGTCKLELPNLGLTFSHRFELIQFAGPLTYAVTGANYTGFVRLEQSQNADNKLAGPTALSRIDVNHLQLQPGVWTNALEQKFDYVALEPLERNRTNYLAYVAAADGEPATDIPDYDTWLLLITDARDADGDGIPDLSDPPAPARRPRLSIRVEDTSVLLTIEGDAGRLCELQTIPVISQTNWSAQVSVTLTNTNHTVTLPLPSGRTSFWRARIP